MYIRLKTIKNQEYGYLVSSKWNRKQKTSKQSFNTYLGRIYKPISQYNMSLKDITKIDDIDSYLDKNDNITILKDLLILTLLNHNFKRNKDIFENEYHYVDIKNLKVYNKKLNPCAIKTNEGYLCDYTLKNLFNIKPSSTNEIDFGKKLARAFIESGVGIDKDLFVLLFDKLYKKEVYNK